MNGPERITFPARGVGFDQGHRFETSSDLYRLLEWSDDPFWIRDAVGRRLRVFRRPRADYGFDIRAFLTQ